MRGKNWAVGPPCWRRFGFGPPTIPTHLGLRWRSWQVPTGMIWKKGIPVPATRGGPGAVGAVRGTVRGKDAGRQHYRS